MFTGTKSTLQLSNRSLCLTAANTKSVLFFCKAAHVVGSREENTPFSLSAISFILFESHKQTGFIDSKRKEKN